MATKTKTRKTHDDKALTKKVQDLRKKDVKWADIGKRLKITPGKAQFLFMVANVKPADRITAQNEKALAKKIVTARDKDKLSWGQIAARTGEPEGKVKKLYDDAGGKGTIANVASARAESNGSTKTKVKKTGKTKTKRTGKRRPQKG